MWIAALLVLVTQPTCHPNPAAPGGVLDLVVVPRAHAFLGERDLGLTPLSARVPSGCLSIRLVGEGAQKIVEVEIAPHQNQHATFDLDSPASCALIEPRPDKKPAAQNGAVEHESRSGAPADARQWAELKTGAGAAPGWFELAGPTGAEVFFDGRSLGRVPEAKIKLPAGTYDLHLLLDSSGHDEWIRARIAPEVSLRCRFRPGSSEVAVVRGDPDGAGYGSISISSKPPSAMVYLRGQKLGRAPLEVRLPIGSYPLELVWPDSDKKKQLEIEVQSGRTLRYIVTAD